MSMKIWLAAKATQQFDAQPAEKPKLYGGNVETSRESGGKYVTLYLDPIDPTVDMPRFPREHVKMITFSGKYHEGFRPEGVYSHRGARAVVKTTVRVQTPYTSNCGDTTSIERYQEISISAKSLRTLREIYTMVRQKKLDPTEKWSDGGRSGVELNDTMEMM